MDDLFTPGGREKLTSDVAVERGANQLSSDAALDAETTGPARIPRTIAVVAAALGLVTLLFCLLGIAYPPQPYYDEHQYTNAARAFLAGEPNPNPEAPPLGKLLIAAGIEAAGDNAFGWRLPSAICGALTLVAVFLWTYLLLGDVRLSLMAAALTLFDNFLFVMSRVAMMDASLLAFLMWSLVAYTAALRLYVSVIKRRILICCSGVLLGLAGACKWNAVDTLAVLLLASFALPWMEQRATKDWLGSVAREVRSLREIGSATLLVGLTALPAISYSLTFWPLCRSLHLPFGFHQLAEMNEFIWHFHRTIISNLVMSSKWYTWPLKTDPQRGLSFLLGNPVVMWGGLLALIVCARRLWGRLMAPESLVLLLYFANVAQWAVTPQHGLFYYYYYPSATLLTVAVAIALRSAPPRVFGLRISFVLLIGAAVVFLWCLPNMAHLSAPWDCAFGCWS